MPTLVTCQQRSQSASSSRPLRVARNSRVSCCRRPLPVSAGTRIVTMTSFLPISIPATRSANSGSSSTSSIVNSYDENADMVVAVRRSCGQAEIWSAGSKHQFTALKAAPGDQTGGRGQARQESTTSADGHAHPGSTP